MYENNGNENDEESEENDEIVIESIQYLLTTNVISIVMVI